MIAIIDYKGGNICSVQNAIARLGFESVVTDNAKDIKLADKVILPGVGEASVAMSSLCQKGLDVLIKDLKQPVLGICLGLQLMCASSEEGEVEGLNIFDAVVKRFPAGNKVPHVGWNNFVELEGGLFDGIEIGDDMYYVHSYYATIGRNTIGVCDYILPFSAAMQKRNFYATQFHPEKSGSVGERLLQNFLEL